MALTSSEDLLLAIVGKSTIQVIPSGQLGLTDSLYDVSPLQPTAVHMTHDNKVIVGTIDKGPSTYVCCELFDHFKLCLVVQRSSFHQVAMQRWKL
jgi:hypothetical protein